MQNTNNEYIAINSEWLVENFLPSSNNKLFENLSKSALGEVQAMYFLRLLNSPITLDSTINFKQKYFVTKITWQRRFHRFEVSFLYLHYYISIYSEAAHTLQVTKDQLAEREKQSLAELEKKKEEEKLVAVKETETKERENKADALNELKQHHLAEIKQLEDNINDLHVTLKEREQFVVRVQHKREQLYDELLKVQADYQNFIDKHPLFDPGQTGYLLQNVQANPAIINPYTDNPKAEN